MAVRMIACPHCGTENSEKRRECYQCREQIGTAPAAPVVTPPVPRPASRPADLPNTPVNTFPATERQMVVNTILFGVSLRQRAQIYRQLQHLLKAGIPMGLSLNYLESSVLPHIRPMARDMAERVQAGGQLSASMARYNTIFPEWEVYVVQAAERGGTLPEAMGSIADTLEQEYQMRSEVAVKLLPLYATGLVFLLTILIVTAVSGGVAGGVAGVLPVLGHTIARFGSIVLAIFLIWQAWRVFGRSRRGARVQQAVMARLPIIGPILMNTMRLRFTRVLAALWKAGVPPMEGLEAAARAANSRHLINRVTEQLPRFGEGATLSEVIAELRIYPQQALYLVRAGETSGTISESLEKVAEYLQVELEAQIKTLPMRVQLVFYAIIAPLVGWFVISFWTRYFGQVMDITGGM